ncbi:MAG: hypothetical protein K8W52_16230, partial [Deltaproteobacteria bacterium]|nr:hypothetical protein [Deltaproteobacteria bacterium]
ARARDEDSGVGELAITAARAADAVARHAPTDDERRAHAGAIANALAAPSPGTAPPAALDAALVAALDARVPLEDLFNAAATAIDARLRSPALTWARLRPYAPGARADVLFRALQAHLGAPQPTAAAIAAATALLDHPALADDAAVDLPLAILAIRGVIALGWHTADAHAIAARLQALPPHPQTAFARDLLPLELEAATALRAAGPPPLPAPLATHLRLRAIAAPEVVAQQLRELARALVDRPTTYLAAFDDLRARSAAAADALARLLSVETPDAIERLEHLPPRVVHDLAHHLRASPNIGATGGLSTAAAVILWIASRTREPMIIGGAALAVVIAAAIAVLLARPTYSDATRRSLAIAMATAGVPAGSLASLIAADPTVAATPGAIMRGLAADHGLALFGLAAAMTRATRLAWQSAEPA